ncbi:hypothetical protein AC622_01060 [Bacillus sp. FJAT-27916]|uniref:glycosyltransferase n=1 Tax=Bacillus sp. FJAT-27916 TaxID=1679169 RepID=UPI0006717A58|nr:glycosyltransferase [Bacillus sp. FJAT-27916]KMY43023.1 hypothetical protein AC622_01060 [Bacillus sp. FJAT-27916]
MKTVYSLINSIDINRGGLTRVMLERASYLADRGYDAKLLTIDYSERYDEIEQTLHATNRLSRKVQILNVYEYYKKLNSRGPVTEKQLEKYDLESQLFEPGFFIEDNMEGKHEARYFTKEGLYVKYKKWTKDGKLEFIDYFDETRAKFKRELYQSSGYKKKVIYFDKSTTIPKQELLYTEDGFCYLNIQINTETKKPNLIFLFDRETNKVTSFGTSNPLLLFHAHWLNEICEAHEQKPYLINDGIFLTHTILKVKKEAAFKICTIHINHFDAPFVYGSPLRKSHVHLLNNIEHIDALVLLTDTQKNQIEKQFGDYNNAHVIPNATRTADIEVYNGEKDPNLISIVGRYHPQKIMDDAIKAFKIVTKQFPDAKLQLFGSGPDEGDLRKLVRDLELDNNVSINGYTTELSEIYGKSLFTVFTSIYEGFGLVLLESMFQKTPVISYDVSYGPGDIIDHQKDGILVYENSVDQLAKEMISMLSNPQLAIDMGEKAHQKVMEKFTYEQTINKWVDLIESFELQTVNAQ